MKYLTAFLVFALAPCLFAQSVNLVDLQQPAASPVQPGTTNHEVLQFRLYKNSGSAASDFTEIRVTIGGTIDSGDWDTVTLYYDADGSRTFNTGDQFLDSATTTLSGQAVFSGFTEPIQDDFFNGRDYLVCVDVSSGATVDEYFQFSAAAADVTVSAGSVSAPFGTINSQQHTVRTDNGCEMDVSRNSVAIPDSTQAVHNVGYVPTGGGNLTFDIDNSGTGTLTLTGTTLVVPGFEINCTVSVTSNPASTISNGGSTSFTINVDPGTATTFSFRLTIENSDFDEHPYDINCQGSATPIPDMSVEYNSSPVANGGSISMGSNTAGVAVQMVFTIINSGSGDLDLTNTPDAVIFPVQTNVSCALTVAPSTTISSGGGSTSFTMEFTPVGGAGNWDFSIQINNNDSLNNPYSISVDGSAPAVTPIGLSVHRQPGLAQQGVIFGQQPVVTVTDANGAVDLSNNGVNVQVTLNNANGASLSGTTTRTSSGGFVSFTNLKIDKEGMGYTLTFTDTSGTFGSVTTPAFNVGPPPPEPEEEESGGGESDDGGCSTGGPGFAWMLAWAALAALFVGVRTLRGISQKT